MIASSSDIGHIVVTAGHIDIEWASRHDSPKQLFAGVRFILKDVIGQWGFFYRDDMGVLKFPINSVDFWEK